jgi:hypothetical protein
VIVSVRTPAYAALVAEIERQVPELKTRVAFEADRDEEMAWPKLGIRVIRAPFRRYQRRVVTKLEGGTVYDVGHFEALVQLKLGAPTSRQRIDLGEKLIGVFLGDGEAAGGLNTTLADVYGATATWDLEDEAWQDEMVFSKKWWQVLTVTGRIPALVKIHTTKLETLRLDFADEGAPTETVYVQQDGTLSLTP